MQITMPAAQPKEEATFYDMDTDRSPPRTRELRWPPALFVARV